MLIDPFTIIAQIINFAVLVIALKLLLFDRVVEAMDTREAAIADQLHQAEQREARADEARVELQDEIGQLKRRRGELLDDARSEADERKREMLESARRDIDEQRRRWQLALQREHRDLERDVRTRSATTTLSICRRVLADLADANLERRSVELAFDRLVAGNDLAGFMETDDGSPITIRTAFGDEQVEILIRDRLAEHGVVDDDRLLFEVDPTLLLGIEFTSMTETIEWHGADYLEQLDGVVFGLLEEADSNDGEGNDDRQSVAKRNRAHDR